MDSWIASLDPHWFWLTAGVLLGAAEILAPGFFLIWLATAAILVGLLSWVVPMSLPLQAGLFAIISIILVYAVRRWVRDNPIESSDPKLNDRGARMVGDIVTVAEAIQNGRGRVNVGDTVWSAQGADAAKGSQVRVTGADGAILLVEPVA